MDKVTRLDPGILISNWNLQCVMTLPLLLRFDKESRPTSGLDAGKDLTFVALT